MRAPAFLTVLFVICSSQTVLAQSQPAKDVTALSVMTQASVAGGWSPYNIPSDAVAHGTMTLERDGSKETFDVVAKARPGGQLRMEVPSKGTVLVLNGGSGKRSTRTETEDVPLHVAPSYAPFFFPFFTLLCDYPSTDVSVTYLGTENFQGQTIHRVELKRGFHEQAGGLREIQSRATRVVVGISATSWLPVKIELSRLAQNNSTSALPVTRTLGDYRRVGSVLIPFRVEEWIAGKRVSVLQISDVQFNVGLSDSDFSLQ